MSDLLIGTSGYDYPEWKGIFYPQDLKRKDFLSYYATQFNALELNNTFYNMPTPERFYSFFERSEGRLQFSVKANRLLTHEIDSTWQTAAEDFKTALTPLQENGALSAVLFQLPESFHYTNDNRIYLANLIQKFEGFPTLVEFRHREWIKESVLEGLEKRNAGIVFCDMPQLKNLPDGTVTNTPFIGVDDPPKIAGRYTKTADNKPEVYVYWNGMQSALASLTKIKDSDKYYGIVSIADFEHFSDDDYLKTLESVEKSGISYLAVRCLDTNQVLVIHDVSRYGTASFGTMNERGNLQKLLYYFTIENGKVLRLTDAELDALESAKN